MRKTTITIMIVLLLTACSMKMQTYRVPDVTKTETISLNKKSNQGNIHKIIVIAEGNINGKATILLILNNSPYKIENLSGNIDFQWESDWYSDTAEIRYEPVSVTSGRLQLKYRLED